MKRLLSILIALASVVYIASCEEEKATYHLGRQLYVDEEYSNAMLVFKELSKRKSVIDDYVYYYLGRSAMKEGYYDEALNAFSFVRREYPDSLLSPFALQYGRLASFIMSNYPSNYIDSEEPIWLKKFVIARGADNALENGYTNIAFTLFRALINKYGDIYSASRFHSLFYNDGAILKEVSSNTLSALATALYEGGSYGDFLAYRTNMQTDEDEDRDYYKMARSFYEIGNSASASYLVEYISRYSYNRAFAIYLLAKYYRSNKDIKTAIKYYEKYVDEYPNGSYIPISYRSLVELYLALGKHKDAASYLFKTFPANRASWHTEIAVREYLRDRFLAGDKKEIERALEALKNIFIGSSRSDLARSWQIHVYREFNKEGYTNAIKEALLHSKNIYYLKEALYYAPKSVVEEVYLSNDYYLKEAYNAFSNGNSDKTIEYLNNLQFLNAVRDNRESPLMKEAMLLAEKAFFASNNFVLSYRQITNLEESLVAISSLNGIQAERLSILYKAGDYENAFLEATNFSETNRSFVPLFRYIEYSLSGARDYGTLMRLTERIGDYLDYPYNNNPFLLPKDFRGYVYPLYYSNEIFSISYSNSVDPYFTLSITREESHFLHTARSWVNATGLMQLMDGTASWLNRKSGVNFSPLMLTNPAQNIHLGTSYIKYLFEMYDSNRFFSAAGYNAGHNAPKRWTNDFGGEDLFRFTRLIPYDETERYVSKVLNSYYFYLLFYDDRN